VRGPTPPPQATSTALVTTLSVTARKPMAERTRKRPAISEPLAAPVIRPPARIVADSPEGSPYGVFGAKAIA
jgi:hypothetical protein